MSSNLSTRINFGIQARLSPTAIEDSTGAFTHRVDDQLIWANGTGADQADHVYERRATLTQSASVTFDVTASGGLLDVFGTTTNLARIKAVYIQNDSATAANLTVGGTNAIVGGGLTLRPAALFMAACADATAYPAANGSTDTIILTNASASVSAIYHIIIIGATA